MLALVAGISCALLSIHSHASNSEQPALEVACASCAASDARDSLVSTPDGEFELRGAIAARIAPRKDAAPSLPVLGAPPTRGPPQRS